MRPTESWGISRGVLWGLLALLALPALWPLLSEGFPKTHDGSVHLIRLFLLDEQVRSGNFFPRWLQRRRLLILNLNPLFCLHQCDKMLE